MPEPLQPFFTFRDILQHLLQSHRRSHQRYAAALQRTDDPRRTAVLTHLDGSEAQMVTSLRRFEQSDNQALLTYVQSAPVAPLKVVDEDEQIDGDLEAIVASYRRRDQALIQLYEQLEGLVGPKAKQVFREFADMVRHSQERLRQAMLDF